MHIHYIIAGTELRSKLGYVLCKVGGQHVSSAVRAQFSYNIFHVPKLSHLFSNFQLSALRGERSMPIRWKSLSMYLWLQ